MIYLVIQIGQWGVDNVQQLEFIAYMTNDICNLNCKSCNNCAPIGNNEEYTILQLANIICDEMKVNQKYVYCDLPEDDPLQRKPDITKANKILNWKPKYDVRNGLRKTIQYFKEIHS